MATTNSFDISTGVDLQEVDNAVNQTLKELSQRFDFKGTRCTVELDRKAGSLLLDADDRHRLEALLEILRAKLIKRGVSPKNLDEGDIEDGTMGRARQSIGLKQGIDGDTARKIQKAVKELGLKKVQISIQGDELRVSGPSRDDLQAVMGFLRKGDWGVELEFGNFR